MQLKKSLIPLILGFSAATYAASSNADLIEGLIIFGALSESGKPREPSEMQKNGIPDALVKPDLRSDADMAQYLKTALIDPKVSALDLELGGVLKAEFRDQCLAQSAHIKEDARKLQATTDCMQRYPLPEGSNFTSAQIMAGFGALLTLMGLSGYISNRRSRDDYDWDDVRDAMIKANMPHSKNTKNRTKRDHDRPDIG